MKEEMTTMIEDVNHKLLKTHNGHKIYVMTNGKFTTEIDGREITRVNLSDLEKIITPPYQRTEAAYVPDTLLPYASTRIRIKTIIRWQKKQYGGNFVDISKDFWDDKDVYRIDPELLKEFTILDQKVRGLEQEYQELRKRLVKLTPEDLQEVK